MDDVVIPALTDAVWVPPGQRYDVAFDPEFLRETTAVADYDAPAKIVVGKRMVAIEGRLDAAIPRIYLVSLDPGVP